MHEERFYKHLENVIIEPYNFEWHTWYENEAENLKNIFEDKILGIEHYGSTAVENMWAKPVIGILLGLSDWQVLKSDLNMLIKLGYNSTIPCNLSGRTYLKKQSPHAFTLAITTHKSSMWFDHLVLRDYLRSHEYERIQYSTVKQEAIIQGCRTLEQYRLYKKPYLEDLFKRAKTWYCKNYL